APLPTKARGLFCRGRRAAPTLGALGRNAPFGGSKQAAACVAWAPFLPRRRSRRAGAARGPFAFFNQPGHGAKDLSVSTQTRPASPGALFRQTLLQERPLQIVGAINANHALRAKRAGFGAVYVSGG